MPTRFVNITLVHHGRHKLILRREGLAFESQCPGQRAGSSHGVAAHLDLKVPGPDFAFVVFAYNERK